MQEESKSVDPKNAQSARTQLKMGAGELNVTGGADQLMEGDFSYNVSEWKPKVSYDVSGQKGELVVKQGAPRAAASTVKPATSGTSASTTRCRPISWCRWERERAILIWTASPLRARPKDGGGQDHGGSHGRLHAGLRRQHTGRGWRGHGTAAQRGWGQAKAEAAWARSTPRGSRRWATPTSTTPTANRTSTSAWTSKAASARST